jgi:hypothetical protein
METPLFWDSDTHRGFIKTFHGTTSDGITHDMGIWTTTTDKKTGREFIVPYDSVEAAIERLNKRYEGFHVIEADVVADFMAQA